MNKELELEISRLREDIQSSGIIQVKPYINGKINVSNPKWHLQTHLNTIEMLIKQILTPPTEEEVCKALSEYYTNKHNEEYSFIYEELEFKAYGKGWYMTINDQMLDDLIMNAPHLITMIGRFHEEEK